MIIKQENKIYCTVMMTTMYMCLIFIKKKIKKSNTLETKIHHMIRFLNIGKRFYFKCIDESLPD